jgi:hypothetical protein
MLNRWGRPDRLRCEHSQRVTIRGGGVERAVCESCGHVSINAPQGLSGRVDRAKFRRVVDRITP